jgi:hypothetical protein
MNKKDILFPIALNSTSELCYAKDAPKDEEYYCTECKKEMILKRGVAGKKRPHFAHKQISPNCYPETVLHNAYKNLLFSRLVRALTNQEQVSIEWACKICGEKHKLNLLENIDKVQLESYVENYKPDMVLLRQGRPVSAIEIIVTHKPEKEAEDYYVAEKISVIKIFLESDEDIYSVENNPLIPPSVEYCLELPRCPKCGNYMEKKYLNITTDECWNCHEPLKVAWITCGRKDNEGVFYGPERFNQEEIELARKNGVIIEERFSKTLQESYNANICPNCGNFIGEFFIHDFVYTEEEKIFIGYSCFSCEYEEVKTIENQENAKTKSTDIEH